MVHNQNGRLFFNNNTKAYLLHFFVIRNNIKHRNISIQCYGYLHYGLRNRKEHRKIVAERIRWRYDHDHDQKSIFSYKGSNKYFIACSLAAVQHSHFPSVRNIYCVDECSSTQHNSLFICDCMLFFHNQHMKFCSKCLSKWFRLF